MSDKPQLNGEPVILVHLVTDGTGEGTGTPALTACSGEPFVTGHGWDKIPRVACPACIAPLRRAQEHPYVGHLHVIARRMDGLEQSIRARNWEDVEFRYDQVLRSFQKLERAVTPAVIVEPPVVGS